MISNPLSKPAVSVPPSVVPRRVLVVEDDPMLAEVVVAYLRTGGHTVAHAADGPSAIRIAEAEKPDLAIIDRMLPGFDGIEVCRRLREIADLPVIMVTALGEESHRVDGLVAGADDYLVKPFSVRELMLRIDAVLRRSTPPDAGQSIVEVGRFRLDQYRREISIGGRPLVLTVREFELLEHFLRNPGRVYRRDELLKAVWDWEVGDMSTVTVHVRRLREKIEVDPGNPAHILTVWGVGYRFDPGVAEGKGAASASADASPSTAPSASTAVSAGTPAPAAATRAAR